METMQLVQTPQTPDLTYLTDGELAAYFADAGLAVDVLARCDAATCPTCFPVAPTKAA